MKVKLKISPTAILEVDGETNTDVFEGLSNGQEVFSHDHCGCCKATDIRFLVRTNTDEDKFYEMRCNKCFARLQFGSMKKPKGALYPKRRWDSLSPGEKETRADQERECKNGYLPNEGWYKYVKKE